MDRQGLLSEKAFPWVAEDIEKHISYDSYRKCNGYCHHGYLSYLSDIYIYICSMTYILTQGHAVDPLILQNDEARVD
jgi:hypothetical protein